MTDAFDADVLIYAATPSHPLGGAVRRLFAAAPSGARAGVGSTLLVPELLTKPHRMGATGELTALTALLARLILVPCDEALARAAVVLGARFALRPMDAVHLATAVSAGASRFVTDNRRYFPRSIDVVEIAYPEDLRGGSRGPCGGGWHSGPHAPGAHPCAMHPLGHPGSG